MQTFNADIAIIGSRRVQGLRAAIAAAEANEPENCSDLKKFTPMRSHRGRRRWLCGCDTIP